MIGTWILRWMALGCFMFIARTVIRAIILRDMWKPENIVKDKAGEILEKDPTSHCTAEITYGGGFVQFLVVLIVDILIWPISTVIAIYNALMVRDEFLK